MKKIALILFAFTALMSCNMKDKESEKMYDEYVEKAKVSEIKEKKCFLGFQFGWSKHEYYSYIDSLVSIKKVYTDDYGYYYDYHTELTISKLKIKPLFFNDTLYQMIYSSDNVAAYIKLFGDFMKRGKGFLPFKRPNILDEKETDYYYIKDNMIVEFAEIIGTDISYMKYTNAPIENKIDSINKDKANQSAKEF